MDENESMDVMQAAPEAEEAPAADAAPEAAALTADTGSNESDEDAGVHDVNALDVVKLGRQGENLTQQVQIDASAWLELLPGCQLVIAALRNGDSAVYLPEITTNDAGLITWPITDVDTARAGWGRAEVRAMLGEKIKKSAVFRTRVEPSLEGGGEAAEPGAPSWVQAILQSVENAQKAASTAAEQAQAAAKQAQTAAQRATEATEQAAAAAANTAGLRGWILTLNADETVDIDYNEEETNT